jgi:hypothetical protein
MSDATLNDLCDINPESIGGSTRPDLRFEYVDISSVHKGTVCWRQVQQHVLASAPSRARRVVRNGDVLLCTVRPNLQSHARIRNRAGRETVASTGFAVLRPKVPDDSSFVFHQLFSDGIAAQFRAMEVGSNYPALNERDVRRVRFFCPPPPERQRIAAVLDLADAALERSEGVITKLQQVRNGLLNDLVTNGIDVVRTAPLASMAAIRFSSVDKLTEHGEMPVRLCNYTDVYKNTYILSSMPFMRATASTAEISRFGLRVGDVIITKDSETPDDIGVPAVVDSTAPDLVCGYHLALIRPDLKCLDPLFLAMQLKHTRLARYFGRQASGSTRYGLSTGSIEQAPILKLPLPEQKRRSDVLREHDRAAAQVALEAEKLRAIKAGLMNDLLLGEVEVPEAVRIAELTQ